MESASSSTMNAHGRQKRVLPSRSRRGGPGVGHCEVDNLILETQRRKFENEPLIPADTPFLLTTNVKSAADPSTDAEPGININIIANDRYFDRPEVLKAFREQTIIQTPEFESIGESSTVGGRFRPRGMEDEAAETSDAAYEKRHRKFETFEKRQRLREKEKLKHEHYKLKERIEQLRAMDGAAFMTLPATSFSPMPQHASSDIDETSAETNPYMQVNGVIPNPEGERRRKEMLDIAIKLEKRYQYLLPPDRVRKAQEPSAVGSTSKKDTESRDGEESDTDRISLFEAFKKDNANLKLRIIPSIRSSASATPAPSPAVSKAAGPKKPRGSTASKQTPSVRVLRNNVSTPPAPLPPTEQRPLASSPYIDVEMETPEPIRLTTPPPPFIPLSAHTEEANVQIAITDIKTASRPGTPEVPIPTQNGTTHVEEKVPITNGTEMAEKQIPISNEREAPLSRSVDVHMADDGESERAPSEDGYMEDREPETTAAEPEPEQGEKAAEDTADMGAQDGHMEMEEEVSPEVRDLSTRLEQATVAGPPAEENPTTDEAAPETGQATEEPFGPASVPGEELESISVRPTKRRRKHVDKTRELSVRTPSVQPGESVHRGGRKKNSKNTPRGATYTTASGQEERTQSLLLIAALRTHGGRSKFGKRATTAFGIDTPHFDKTIDFELPEELLYPPDLEETDGILPAENAPDDNARQENPVVPATSPAPAQEEQHEQPQHPSPAESGEPMDIESPEVQPSEPAHVEQEIPVPMQSVEPIHTQPIEPPQPTEFAQPTEPTESAHPTESVKSYEPAEPFQQEGSFEVASPEAEPTEDMSPLESEVDSGVRPRELSRHDGDDEEEQLEW